MQLISRLVYLDCREAHHELKNGLVGSLWRRRWVAFITLIRAIGHVLKEVDGNKWNGLDEIVSTEWDKWKQEPIFKEFIENERNNVLKQYKFKAQQNLNFDPSRSEISYSMEFGYFHGKDPREIAEMALDWWDEKLKLIESKWENRREDQIFNQKNSSELAPGWMVQYAR